MIPTRNFQKHISTAIFGSVVVALVLAMPGTALAFGAAYFPQATTLQVIIAGTTHNLTISAGSDADAVSVATGGATFSVTIASGETFIVTSTEGLAYSADNGYLGTCTISGATHTSVLTITSSTTKTVTVGFTGGLCQTSTAHADTTSSGGGGGGGYVAPTTPTPTPSVSLTPTPTPSVSPSTTSVPLLPPANPSVALRAAGLKEGDTASSPNSSDPDVYIVNEFGYKRLFLNPIIFSFYGHLGGFSAVKSISATNRDMFPTSGLFRNCETGDQKVYGFVSTGEDTGELRWVNTSGAQAVSDDPNFFHKVFCINTREFNWYTKSSTYFTSVGQVPSYRR